MRRPVALALCALLVTALAALPFLALANHEPATDGNDTRGPLDVRRVTVKGTRAKPKWRVSTFARWGARSIWDKGYGLVRVDALGDDHFDHYALVRSNGYALDATLWRDRKRKDDVRVGRLHVARSDRRSFSVRIPLRRLQMPDARPFYRWYVETIAVTRRCPRACLDRAPDDGSVTEVVAGPSPTTTRLPTPSIPPVTPTSSGTPPT